MTTAGKAAEIESIIRARAHARVASIFKLEPQALRPSSAFGHDLHCTFVSDFRANEYDRLDQDIKDVADRETRRRLATGELVIRTVAEYCDDLVTCFATRPGEVVHLLELDKHATGLTE